MANIKHYKQGDASCALSHYDSIAEMEQDALFTPMQREQNARLRDATANRSHGGTTWYGVATLPEVKRILKEGYAEGAAKVDALYDAIAPKLPRAVDFRRQLVRSDQGDSLDIHAVNRGAIDKAWQTAKRKARAGSGLIRIVADICGNAGVSAEKLQWRGVAALALSRAMSKAGYSVEIAAGLCVAGSNSEQSVSRSVHTVTVKPRYAAVDTATLAAALCLPGFFRFLGFVSIIKQGDELGADVYSHLGYPSKLETVLPVPEKISQVIVPETVNNRESAEAWVKEAVTMLQGATVDKEQQR